MLLVAFSDIESLPAESVSSLIASLPIGMHAYLNSGNVSETARLERICAIRILCDLLEKSGHTTSLTIERDKNGRPYFKGNIGLDFNISHSGGMCACVLSDSRVGIDLQEEIPNIDIRRLAFRFFAKEEQLAIRKSDDPRAAFFSLWTKKEALGKYLGDGVVPALKLGTEAAYAEHGVAASTTVRSKGERRFHATVCFQNI